MKITKLKTLKKLDFTRQKAFAYLMCERLYPNYEYFSNNFDFGNPTVLSKGIDFLYRNIFENNPNINQIDRLIDEAELNVPEINTIFACSAADACTALYHSLCFFIDKDFSNITDISTAATSSVDMFISETEDLVFDNNPDSPKKRKKHRLMQKEIAVQSGIITFLSQIKDLDYRDIEILLRLEENNEIRKIG